MSGFINLKKLNYEELSGVVNLYPWYGGARVEMCHRMAEMGGDFWGPVQFGEAAMYIGDRRKIGALLRKASKGDYSDKDIEKILKTYLDENKDVTETLKDSHPRVAGGDFFSQSQYERVRKEGDNVFSRFAAKAIREVSENDTLEGLDEDFCTETLARIYEEQGYYEQAKSIYSKLLLNFPEKNAYFAALIENLEKQEVKKL